jgi:hypothetical protein
MMDRYDVMAMVGMVMVCVGAGMAISLAAGLAVGGTVLLVIGLFGAWRKGGEV